MTKRLVKRNILSYLQPVMLALAPLSIFISNNVDIIKPSWAIRPISVLSLLAIVITFTCHRLIRDHHRSTILASLITILVLHSGLLLIELNKIFPRFGITGLPWFERERQQMVSVLTLLVLAAVISGLNQLLKQHPKFIGKLAVVFNITALTLLISSVIVAVGAILHSREITADPTGISNEDISRLIPPDPLPNIYYLVLDSYPGVDSLEEEFGFDNLPFVTYLEDQGFNIDHDALSNYYRSAYSIASTLNLDYVHDLADRSGIDKLDGFALSRSIRQSAIRRILSDFGYQTVSFDTGFFLSDVVDADIYFSGEPSGFNPVEAAILPWSVYGYLIPFAGNNPDLLFAPTYTSHINRISNTLDMLGETLDGDVPSFVVAHIIAPHPPFVFDREGRITIPPRPFGFDDAGGFLGTPEEYRGGFAGQTGYINQRLTAILDHLLADSSRPTIIILQGDHGVRWKCNMETATCEDIRVAFSILNALYLPGVEVTQIESGLSPVNTFRLILNKYFGGQIAYLPDSTNISVGDWMILDNIEPVDIPGRP